MTQLEVDYVIVVTTTVDLKDGDDVQKVMAEIRDEADKHQGDVLEDLFDNHFDDLALDIEEINIIKD